MIVFDASGSMAGNVDQGIATIIPRIDEVRGALASVLPTVTRARRVGLITYGPGPYQQCNVQLNLKPTENAAGIIMQEVNALNPAGKTPLTAAVKNAAEVLDYRHKPGLIVVLTDGEETCGGSPCDLGKELHASAAQLTVHIIGYRMKDFSWTGEQSILDAKCLAEENGGLYISTEFEAGFDRRAREDARLSDAVDARPVPSRALPPPPSIEEIRASDLGKLRLAWLPAGDDLIERHLLFDLPAELWRSRQNVDRHLVVLVLVRGRAPLEAIRCQAVAFAQDGHASGDRREFAA